MCPKARSPVSPGTYHHQNQEEDDGAAEVGVLVLPGLVLQVIDQLQGQLLLQHKTRTEHGDGASRAEPGCWDVKGWLWDEQHQRRTGVDNGRPTQAVRPELDESKPLCK